MIWEQLEYSAYFAMTLQYYSTKNFGEHYENFIVTELSIGAYVRM